MITFTSKAYENISYFNEVALNLLSLMGHSGEVPGALKGDEVGPALASLQKAMSKSTGSAPEDNDTEANISLKQRAHPLLKMLEAAMKENCSVLWS